MARDRNDPNYRSSAEWPAPPPYVTQDQFHGMVTEQRLATTDIKAGIDQIRNDLHQGELKFQQLMAAAADCKEQRETHGKLLDYLRRKEQIRDVSDQVRAAKEELEAEAARPRKKILFSLVSKLVTVVVMAILLFVWDCYRDYVIAHAPGRSTTPTPTTVPVPTPVPAPIPGRPSP